mgnify:CR=1 FL=1
MDTGSGHTAYQYSYSQFLSGQNISGQGENGMRPRVKLLFLSCCHGSLSHRSLSGGCRIIQIQVFLLHNRVSDSTRSDTGKIYLWLFMSLWMVSGSASQNSRKEIFHSQAEASAVSEIHHPCSFCDPSAMLATNSIGMGDPFFCKYICPQGVLEGAIPLSIGNAAIRSALGKLFSFKFCILIAVIVLSIMFYRPFCKWICPLGAIYSLFNRVSLLNIKIEDSKCVGCNQCTRACKMDIDVCRTPNHPECIRCGACIRACPKDAIHYQFMGKPCQKKDSSNQ